MATDFDCGLWESFTEERTAERILKDKKDFEMELNSSTSERFRGGRGAGSNTKY